MSAISETYKRAHKILGLEDILPNASVTLIKQEMIITNKNIHKDIFACLFSIHNIISLSCHEQVSLSGLRFERYFSHHRAR